MSFINLYSYGFIGFIFFIFINILIFRFRIKNPFIYTITIFFVIFLLILLCFNENFEIISSSLIIYIFLCVFYTLFLLGLNNSVSVKLMVKIIYKKELNKNIFFDNYVYKESFKNRLKFLENNKYVINKNNSLYLTEKSKQVLKIYNILVKIFLKNGSTG